MHAYLLQRQGRSYAVVREERGVLKVVESGLDWSEAIAVRLRWLERDPPPPDEPAPVASPRYPNQPGRRKTATDRTLVRASRSLVTWRRPYCRSCERFMPAPDEPREHWLEPNGHRTPDGEVCPSGKHVVVLSPMDRRVLQAMRAVQADNDNGTRLKRKRRRKKRRKGRQKRKRWVQLLLVDTPQRARAPRVKLVRALVVPRWTQLGLEEWLYPPAPARAS